MVVELTMFSRSAGLHVSGSAGRALASDTGTGFGTESWTTHPLTAMDALRS